MSSTQLQSTPALDTVASQSAPISSQAVFVDEMQAGSPASDATVIASAATRRSIMMLPMKGHPGSNAAIFSTDDGRMPAQQPQMPLPPVISRGLAVESDRIYGVVLYANSCRNKYPHYYHRIFPNGAWTIKDLWDAAEVHIQEPVFLVEVLGFIMRDNAFRASRYAKAWSREHPEKLELIGGDMTGIYDPLDSLAIVDRIFTDGENNAYPKEFLWHALHFMRFTMKEISEQTRSLNADGNLPAAAGAAVRRHHPGITGPTVRTPSHSHLQPLNGFPIEPGPVSMVPSYAERLLNPRNRLNRSSSASGSGSGAYNQPLQGHGWADNVPMHPDQHMLQLSGPFMHGQAPRHPSNMSNMSNMSTGPAFVSNMNQMPQFPLMSPMVSPNMHPAHMAHPVMMQHRAMPQQPPPASHAQHRIEPAYRLHDPNAPGPRDMPLGDMTNGMQYTTGRGSDRRGLDHRGMMVRRNSMANSQNPVLFNPYGAERPDKAADFSQIPNNKRGNRSSVSNNPPNRPRKYSNSYRYGSNSFDRDEGIKPNGGHYPERERTVYSQHDDPKIVSDKVYGCSAQYIGPKNDTVKYLYVSNLPGNVTGPELLELLKTKADAVKVDLKPNYTPDHVTHAFVHFNSPAQARLCLSSTNRIEMRGKTLNITVPHHFFRTPVTPGPQREPQLVGPSAARSSTYDRNDSGAGLGEASDRPQYSPQDARSDLHRTTRQPQNDCPATRGSPQERKAKTLNSPIKQAEVQSKELGTEVEATAFVDKTEVAQQQPAIAGPATENITEDSATFARITSLDPILTVGTIDVHFQDIVQEPTNPLSPVIERSMDEVAAKVPGPLTFSLIDQNIDTSVPTEPDLIERVVAASVLAETTADPSAPLSPKSLAPPVSANEPLNAKKTEGAQVQEKQTEDTGVTIIAKSSCAQDETTSDDDQKNDLSFHSAQEAQDDSVVASQAGAQQAAPGPTEVKSKVPEANTVLPSLGPAKPPSESGKKQGAQQTQSLHPWAKPSKAQKDKEKKAKKKEKKKEKGKGGSTSTQGNLVDEQKKDKGKTVGAPHAPQVEEMDTQAKVNSDPKDEPQQPTVVQHAQQISTCGGESVDTSQDGPGSNAPAPGLAVSDGVAVNSKPELERTTRLVPVAEVDVAQPGTALKNQAQYLPQIAVPKLGSLKKASPSNRTSRSPTGCVSRTASPTRMMSRASEQSTHGKGQALAPQDTISVASSPTLCAPSPLEVLGTATTEFFTPMPTPTATLESSTATTPTPAPTAATMPAIEAPTPTSASKKKTRNKEREREKRKAKKAAQEDPSAKEDPFQSQLNEIAGVQSNATGNQSAQGTPEKRDAKSSRSIIGSISTYVKRKVEAYDKLPDRGWRGARKGVSGMGKLMPEELAHMPESKPEDINESFMFALKYAPVEEAGKTKFFKKD